MTRGLSVSKANPALRRLSSALSLHDVWIADNGIMKIMRGCNGGIKSENQLRMRDEYFVHP